MARRRRNLKRQSDEGTGLLEYVSLSLDHLRTLAASDSISNKLLAFNALLFSFLAAVLITNFFVFPSDPLQLVSVFIFLVSLALLVIGSPLYVKVFDVLASPGSGKINTLRIGSVILLVDLPIAIGGFSFSLPAIVNFAWAILAFHVVAVPVVAFTSLPFAPELDRHVEPNQIWTVLGRAGSVASIGSLLITLGILTVKAIAN